MANTNKTPAGWLAHVDDCEICAERIPRADGGRWQSGHTTPAASGWYERLFTDGLFRQYWSGEAWSAAEGGRPHWRQVGDYPSWREITDPA